MTAPLDYKALDALERDLRRWKDTPGIVLYPERAADAIAQLRRERDEAREDRDAEHAAWHSADAGATLMEKLLRKAEAERDALRGLLEEARGVLECLHDDSLHHRDLTAELLRRIEQAIGARHEEQRAGETTARPAGGAPNADSGVESAPPSVSAADRERADLRGILEQFEAHARTPGTAHDVLMWAAGCACASAYHAGQAERVMSICNNPDIDGNSLAAMLRREGYEPRVAPEPESGPR